MDFYSHCFSLDMCTQFSHSTLEHTIQRAHCVIIVEETMDSEALFGAKTKASTLLFVQHPRPLTWWNFVLGLKNIVHCTQYSI